ncbi:hypothetical protein Tco_1066125 [Tanacetum coccineum]
MKTYKYKVFLVRFWSFKSGFNGKGYVYLSTYQVPHHGIDLWLQVQIFYNHVDNTIQRSIDYAAGRKLRKLRPDEAWSAIERLAHYENEGWNDAVIPEDASLDYKNPDIEQLLRIMEHKVDIVMKDAISLMGKSESAFRLATNKMYRPPSEPSCQEEFEHIMMNFIYDQEERIRQLENYMQDITDEFMEFYSEVALRVKERIKESETRSTRGQASSSYEETMEEKVRKFRLFDNENHQMNHNNLVGRFIHSEDVVDWEFLSNKGLAQSFFESINTNPFSGLQWVNLFQINEPIFRELVREFFSSFEFDSSLDRYDPLHKGVTFRLGGAEREMSFLIGKRGVCTFEGIQRISTLSKINRGTDGQFQSPESFVLAEY